MMINLKRKNGPFSISMPYDLLDHIDKKRGDISRSKFLLRIVEKDLSMNSWEAGTSYEGKNMPADDMVGYNHRSDISLKRGDRI